MKIRVYFRTLWNTQARFQSHSLHHKNHKTLDHEIGCLKRIESNTPIFHVDAFTKKPFSGNPACVVMVNRDANGDLPTKAWMQNVASENNVPVTAFVSVIPFIDAPYRIRWYAKLTALRFHIANVIDL